MNYANNASLRLRLEAWRARLMILLLMAAFLSLTGRALYLQSFRTDFLQQKGEARYGRVIKLPPLHDHWSPGSFGNSLRKVAKFNF